MATKNCVRAGNAIPTTCASVRCVRTHKQRPSGTRGRLHDKERESPIHRYNLRKRPRINDPEPEYVRSKKQKTDIVPKATVTKSSRLKRPRADDAELEPEHSKKQKTIATAVAARAKSARPQRRLRPSQGSPLVGDDVCRLPSPVAVGPPTPVHTPDRLSLPPAPATTIVAPDACGDQCSAQTHPLVPTTIPPPPPAEPASDAIQPSPPYGQDPNAKWGGREELLENPKPYPMIPYLDDFKCTFVREIQTSETASVLVVSMPDSSQRILKLFSPDFIQVYRRELEAYCALTISVPPTTPGKRIVPYCYGSLRLRSLRQLKRSTGWKSPMRKAKLPLRGLLLELIPNADSIMNDQARLVQKPHLADEVVDALRLVHSAGVLHEDTMPRNMMLDDKDGVWWIDFGSALSTAFFSIHPRAFIVEQQSVERLLKHDVIPSVREGRIPFWQIIGC
jgi:hypothetical protein